MKEIWLVPHRDGMLKIDARITQLNPRESAMIELLATNELVTLDMAADRIWPGKRPNEWRKLLIELMVRVRRALPCGFVRTVYAPNARVFNFLHAVAPMLGWQIVGQIHINREPSL